MPCVVSVHADVEMPDIANSYAKALETWKNSRVLPDRFGNEGQWESNSRLCDSFVYKLHIRLPSEPGWKKTKAQIDRHSNHYLVFSRHWLDYDNIQIISIMSPDGHEKARTSYMYELERRAEEFQSS
ncbi:MULTISPECIES: type II toxin-antitoxin system YafO family toxin [Gammaproteobacteria]|uniref:type II toxin-antitoxin system YafO family toxin n=1 Tax=Gammaproteobacteria TaxID=1236 RepID=UPI0016448A86|nr:MULTISPECIES: type II toxin-antitoxin system YafO family toxin [Gammaproteobacteria]MBC3994383.1 type II toxin-antitoxin system YafO family toxin [Morganella morganii]MBS5192776.1 type II toxin-antitoxin system YafO family toxin [Morganella morganii]MCG6489682.1 type II toxin-antitoxin system YafO family toxin [Vibrio parahaemolyticus]HDU8583262.1 type II toxin-antitoxin system YafO family toxin [Morganella morganii]